MKSVVLENQQGQAVLLQEDGTFANRNGITADVGAEITVPIHSKKKKNPFRGLIAAVVITLLLGGAGAYAYATPSQPHFLNPDVNPSVQQEYNLVEKEKGHKNEIIKSHSHKSERIKGHYGYDMVQKAKEYGMTPGKYNTVTHVLGISIESQADADKYINTSVPELMKAEKEKKNPPPTNNSQGN